MVAITALLIALALQATQVAGSNGDSTATTDASTDPVVLAAQQAKAQADAVTAQLKAQAEAAAAEQAVYDARTAAAKSKSAASDAQAAAAKAQLGGIPAVTAVSGSSVAGADTAKGEALLLIARAETLSAHDLVLNLANLPSTERAKGLVIVTDLDQLSTGDAVQFDYYVSSIKARLLTATAACSAATKDAQKPQTGPAGSEARMAFLPFAGAILDSAAKIAGYFQTDYTFGATNPTEPALLQPMAVAYFLKNPNGCPANVSSEECRGLTPLPNFQVISGPLTIPALVSVASARELIHTLTDLGKTADQTAGAATSAKAIAAGLRAKDKAQQTPKDAADLAKLDAGTGAADKALAAYEAFLTAMTPTASQTGSPLMRVAKAKAVQAALGSSANVLLLQTTTAGQYYTKKNLWTFFGGPPLYTMGAVVTAYTVFNPATGAAEMSGTLTKHGGYRSVDRVQAMFK